MEPTCSRLVATTTIVTQPSGLACDFFVKVADKMWRGRGGWLRV